jgi:hypothetical protein
MWSRKDEYSLVERFGAISVALALVLDGEAEEESRFCFDVDISAPLVGLIVAYRGTLEPAGQA